MREDLANHRGLFDGGDDLQLAPAVRAMRDVDVEDALEQARPTHARGSLRRRLGGFTGFLERSRHDRGTQSGVRGEHAVEADQVQARARYQRGQALQITRWSHLTNKILRTER
jgi:hypothetical protein